MQKKRESSKRIFSLFGFFGIFAKYFCMEINKKTYKSLRFIFSIMKEVEPPASYLILEVWHKNR